MEHRIERADGQGSAWIVETWELFAVCARLSQGGKHPLKLTLVKARPRT